MPVSLPDGMNFIELLGSQWLKKRPIDLSLPTGILFPNGDDPLAYQIYRFDLSGIASPVTLVKAEADLSLPVSLDLNNTVLVAKIGVYRSGNGVWSWVFQQPAVGKSLVDMALTTAADLSGSKCVNVIVMCDVVPTGPGRYDLPVPTPCAECSKIRLIYSVSDGTSN